MSDSTASAPPSTTPSAEDLPGRLAEHLTGLLAAATAFGRSPPTPAAAFAFEKKSPISSATSAARSSPTP